MGLTEFGTGKNHVKAGPRGRDEQGSGSDAVCKLCMHECPEISRTKRDACTGAEK
jgi:hypothetical protein